MNFYALIFKIIKLWVFIYVIIIIDEVKDFRENMERVLEGGKGEVCKVIIL